MRRYDLNDRKKFTKDDVLRLATAEALKDKSGSKLKSLLQYFAETEKRGSANDNGPKDAR